MDNQPIVRISMHTNEVPSGGSCDYWIPEKELQNINTFALQSQPLFRNVSVWSQAGKMLMEFRFIGQVWQLFKLYAN